MVREATTPNASHGDRPLHRELNVYAFDPSIELEIETARVNRSILPIAWEEGLCPGPVGSYVEVVDVDPPSRCAYAPVDLNHPYLIAKRGLEPSEGSPQFHQQMVYAVAMKTIENFERGLGRTVQWSRHPSGNRDVLLEPLTTYVPRLRIYPHALREANAYYSPDKKALLFGYFNASNIDPRQGLPGGIVFTCLSHDIIAHETTHAILDGIHRGLLEPTNPDVLAFHEAFADLVAIFQHFTLPGVLDHEIAKTRGNLSTQNLLSQLAVQFGRATQRGTALRDALGAPNAETGQWQRKAPDPQQYSQTHEPHARGALLVAALFDAFLVIYESHTKDLLRIASGGTGILPDGELHPDVVRRLANEAATVAERLLRICIRALDYLPPTDVTFGDFLRALITIDSDLVPDDPRNYRVAIIRAFRDRGIYPADVRTLSVESLRWEEPNAEEQDLLAKVLPGNEILRLIAHAHEAVEFDRTKFMDGMRQLSTGQEAQTEGMRDELLSSYERAVSRRDEQTSQDSPDTTANHLSRFPNALDERREREFLNEIYFADYLRIHLSECFRRLNRVERKQLKTLLGIDPAESYRVTAVRPTTRVAEHGRTKNELVVLMTQRETRSLPVSSNPQEPDANESSDSDDLFYRFSGGCTLLIDPITGRVNYCINKRIDAERRRRQQEAFLRQRLTAEGLHTRARYYVWQIDAQQDDGRERSIRQEPFRLLHVGEESENWG